MALLITLGIAIAGCTSPGASSLGATHPSDPPPVSSDPGSVGPSADRDASWRADLEQIIPGMEAIHPHLFHGTSRSDLQAAVDELSAHVPQASDDELMVGVLRVVALVSAAGCEGHTGAFVWGAGTYPVDSLPLRLWLFGPDLVVVDALAPYRSLIGSRIDAIDGHPTSAVLAAIASLVPHDNAQTIRLVSPRLVLIPQVLRGLGLADDGPISLRVSPAKTPRAKSSGDRRTLLTDPIPMSDYNSWAGAYGLHLPIDPKVRYLSRIGDALWWEMLKDPRHRHTLYVQYNRVDPLPATQLADLRSALRRPSVRRVVLDVRHNYGGEVSALAPIVTMFAARAKNRPAPLFVVTGRNTFSAGSLLVARLQREANAVVVGEPMGGCPTTWGNPSEFTLPFSGLVVSVASELSVGVSRHDPRLTIVPDIRAPLTVREWLAGLDPALEATDVDGG